MLKSWINFDRDFDDVVKRSYPYLIFPSQEFRDELAEQLDSLCQYYRERNEAALPGKIKKIKEMLDNALFDDMTQLKIHYFELDQATTDEKFRKIEERLSKLETHQRSLKKNKIKKRDTLTAPEVRESIDNVGESVTCVNSLVAEIGEMVVDAPSIPKSLSNRDKVEKCIKSSTVPLTNEEISNITGLRSNQISFALNSPRIKPYLDVSYIRKPAKYRDSTRNFKTATYFWNKNK